jgi:hypothetical protein
MPLFSPKHLIKLLDASMEYNADLKEIMRFYNL